MNPSKNVKIQSVQRALNVFELLNQSLRPLSALEISQQTGLNRSTVHSIIDTLIACNYVEKEPANGKYVPTIKMYALSYGFSDRLPVVRFCSPLLNDLAIRFDIALNMGILTQENELFLIKKYIPRDYINRSSGFSLDFHATSLGKIQLAFLPEEKVKGIIDRLEMAPHTKNTITDKAALCRELDAIRRQGYATDKEEYAYGVACLGFPIFGRDRQLAGSFSLSGNVNKVISHYSQMLPAGLQTSKYCSVELGCHNPPYFIYEEAKW